MRAAAAAENIEGGRERCKERCGVCGWIGGQVGAGVGGVLKRSLCAVPLRRAIDADTTGAVYCTSRCVPGDSLEHSNRTRSLALIFHARYHFVSSVIRLKLCSKQARPTILRNELNPK